ncbi:hypothetical protein JQ633_21660 [Bradyrhizobium tropiciagri]|uniref:hypothetical protein n=1 Tax=Bradyrhizobium tropiciagri TaxID=312253 RepID=UPI001BA78F6E|nr:hypothetical protein [Bradyrhizobium tropiciagri]MBR0872978.1 hypothetical protein [Bradyrhizobium tropiciagri]
MFDCYHRWAREVVIQSRFTVKIIGVLISLPLVTVRASADTDGIQSSFSKDRFFDTVRSLRHVRDLRNDAEVKSWLPFEMESRQRAEAAGPDVRGRVSLFGADSTFFADYVIDPPNDHEYRAYVKFVLTETRLCLSRNDILAAMGPDDPRPHPGYPADLSDAAMDRLIGILSEHRPDQPLVMTYAPSGLAEQPLTFVFYTSHCATDLMIGTDTTWQPSMPMIVQ